MPLKIPKENATPEEINLWIIETQETYDKMETDLTEKTQKVTELQEHNQKLFLRVTTNKEEPTKEDDKEIPSCIDKKTFELLNDKELKELNELIEEE